MYYNYKKVEDEAIVYKDFSSINNLNLIGENIYILELFDGINIKIFVDKNSNMKFIYNKSLDEKQVEEYMKILNLFFAQKIKLLAALFGGVEFVIFGKCINYDDCKIKYLDNEKSIIFTDLFLNDNWMLQDDITKYFNSFNIPTPDILFEGLYGNDIIKDFVENYRSVMSIDKVPFGFAIKDEMEEGFDKARDRAVLTVKSAAIELIEKEEKEKVKDFVDTFLVENFFSSEEKFERIKEFSEKFKKETFEFWKKKYLQECIDYVCSLLNFSLKFHNKIFDNELIEKELRKRVGSYLSKKYFFEEKKLLNKGDTDVK